MSRPHTFPPGPISHLMVRMAMNRHLLGPEYSEPLDIFSEPSLSPPLSHKTYCLRLERWGRTSTEVCTVANELYVRCQHRFEISSSKNFEYIPVHDICPHISLDPGNVMEPIIKCLLSHRNTASCENCKGLGQCRSCTTESEIQISPLGPADHVIETTYWKNFGAGRSPDDPKWMQHELPLSPDLQAAKFSPGSVRTAFESEKHKNMQISIRNTEWNKPLSRSKKMGLYVHCDIS